MSWLCTSTSNKISRLLAKHNIKTLSIFQWNFSTLRPIKDNLGLKNIWGVLHSMWIWQSVCGPNFQDHWNQMPRIHKTPAPWPDRKVSCSRTPTKHRTWNPIWENSQTEQEDQIHGPDCERSNRNSTTCRKRQQGGWLYVKSYMAASSQYTEMLSTTRNRQPRPSATTFWLLPLTRRIALHPVTGQMEIYTVQRWTHSNQFWCYQTTSTPRSWGWS
jgi:hypothetical protein